MNDRAAPRIVEAAPPNAQMTIEGNTLNCNADVVLPASYTYAIWATGAVGSGGLQYHGSTKHARQL